MARRIDFYDDPNAPKPNSLVPSVNVVVTNDAGDLLMIRRSDNGNWAVPGARSTSENRSRRPPYGKPSKRPASYARSPAWSAPTPTRNT